MKNVKESHTPVLRAVPTGPRDVVAANAPKFGDSTLAEVIAEASGGAVDAPTLKRLTSRHRTILAFGALVRDARRERGLTQAQLAAKAQVSKSTIAAIEAGAMEEGPRIGTLFDLLFVCHRDLNPASVRTRFLEAIDATNAGDRRNAGAATVMQELNHVTHSPRDRPSLSRDCLRDGSGRVLPGGDPCLGVSKG